MPPKRKAAKKVYEPRPSKKRAGNGPGSQESDAETRTAIEPEEVPHAAQSIERMVAAAVAKSLPAALATFFPPVQQAAADTLRPERAGLSSPQRHEPTHGEDDDELVAESVHHHVAQLSGKDEDDYEDETSFLYSLSDKELRGVGRGEYLDFLQVYRRAKGELDLASGPAAKKPSPSLLTKDVWIRIFLAFMAEHTRIFPRDAPAMAAYLELVISMESLNMDWLRYDESFRMARARRMLRGDLRPKPWNRMDVPLYVACSIGSTRFAPIQGKQKPTTARPAPAATVSKAPPAPDVFDKKMNTCWKFQDASCDGSCLWPFTHNCYYCGGDHPTRLCPALRPEVPKAVLRAPQKEPFRDSQEEEWRKGRSEQNQDRERVRDSDRHKDGDRSRSGSDARRRH